MSGSSVTKYQRDVFSSKKCSSILKAMQDKPFPVWKKEHEERLKTAALLMHEMGMGNRVYEFHDADLIKNPRQTYRVKTFSDFLKLYGYDVTIVSRQLDSGNFDGVSIIKSNDYYGGLPFYLTSDEIKYIDSKEVRKPQESLSIRYMDTLIFDNFNEYIEYYLRNAVSLKKDCFIPVIGYKNSSAAQMELKLQNHLKSLFSSNRVLIEDAEVNNKDNGFVKILKISRK